ncbi:MAG: spermidine/putrescine transport system substrate-binding protein [Chloroflexota bacterium]|jgi:spermidine/putrescine transport system substrate-binding protein|nr:spermidine/putrescine transport system substrate-binding protein [Chloroflexota bacterium]
MATERNPINPDLTRRRFLQGTAFAGVAAFLAACTGQTGTESQAPASVNIPTPPPVSPTPSAAVAASPTPLPSPTGPLKFANWPAYIDLTGKAYDTGEYTAGSSPTIEQFKKKYGVLVDYEEKIEDNKTFYATIQPQFQAGSPTGWDLIVITDWLAAKVISKGWAEKIDQGNVPNATANLVDALKNQVWDPGNDYHYPWQSGMTGIGFNTKVLKAANIPEPKSLKDLWAIDSKKVSFLTESRDTFGLGLLKLGKAADPSSPTIADDLQAVHDDIKPLVEKGLIFADNSYLKNFAAKKTWAAMVWSGDLASSGTEGDTFQVPDEGVMIWTDNLLIPKGATNKYTAELMINFVYDPKIAAQIEDYVYYVCPVKGADVEIKKLDAGAESNPLIFPPADIQAKYHNFQFLSDDIEAKLDELYLDLTGG